MAVPVRECDLFFISRNVTPRTPLASHSDPARAPATQAESVSSTSRQWRRSTERGDACQPMGHLDKLTRINRTDAKRHSDELTHIDKGLDLHSKVGDRSAAIS